MEENIKKNSCPNCCQTYSLESLAPEPTLNIPLFLKCGHSMCECCIRKIIESGKPLECMICQRVTEINTKDIVKLLQNKKQLYTVFPVNVSVLGELALKLIVEKPEVEENKAGDYFVDLQAILESTDQTQGQCLECHSETSKMCQQCATVICAACFDKSHKSFAVFKNHVLQNIEQQATTSNCKVHCQKALEYYCKDCAKSICMDCFMVGSEKSCKNHDVVPIPEINEMFMSDLREILPEVDATFRRLTKTAVDIGHELVNMDKDSGSPELLQVTASIEQHFSKLQAVVQTHRQEVMENIARLRRIERDSLLRIRDEVATAIKQSKQVMDALKSALDCEKNQTTNLSALLEEAKEIIDGPWCLTKEESDKDELKVCVSEELCLLVSDYVQLVGNAQARYGLRCSRQLPAVPAPPRAPVYPPTAAGGLFLPSFRCWLRQGVSELCLLVSDYVQLVGNAQARYGLRCSSQLPAVPAPPRAPVYPPTPAGGLFLPSFRCWLRQGVSGLCLLVSDYVQLVGNAQARYGLRCSSQLPAVPAPPRAPVYPPTPAGGLFLPSFRCWLRQGVSGLCLLVSDYVQLVGNAQARYGLRCSSQLPAVPAPPRAPVYPPTPAGGLFLPSFRCWLRQGVSGLCLLVSDYVQLVGNAQARYGLRCSSQLPAVPAPPRAPVYPPTPAGGLFLPSFRCWLRQGVSGLCLLVSDYVQLVGNAQARYGLRCSSQLPAVPAPPRAPVYPPTPAGGLFLPSFRCWLRQGVSGLCLLVSDYVQLVGNAQARYGLRCSSQLPAVPAPPRAPVYPPTPAGGLFLPSFRCWLRQGVSGLCLLVSDYVQLVGNAQARYGLRCSSQLPAVPAPPRAPVYPPTPAGGLFLPSFRCWLRQGVSGLCLLVSDYVQLVGNAQARYGLRCSSQLPAVPAPPRAPVYPPTPAGVVKVNKAELDQSPPATTETLRRGQAVNGAAEEISFRSKAKNSDIQTVVPFANKPIGLKTGTQEQARITHMQDPHHFYVRRLCDDSLLAEIENRLDQYLGDVSRDVAVGKLYAVKHDNTWKRGLVGRIYPNREAGQPKYHVTCIDYGYTACSDELRDIPALDSCPALALRCRLANCEPDGTWHHKDTALMLRMVDKAPVTLHVRRAGASSECDVTTLAGVSVAHVLRFHARAALVDPSLPYPEVASAAPLRLQPADTTLRSSSGADVVITHVVSPDKYYVRECRLQDDYVKLCQELNNAYDVRDESDLIFLPKEGSVYVARVGEDTDTHWARAQVLAANVACDVRVWLPDTGRQLSVPWHRLRAARPRFTALRAMAIESHLAGITPVGGRWHESAGELLAQHAGRDLRLLPRASRRRSLGAVLLDPHGPVCLNRELLARQLATADGSIDFEALILQYDPEKESIPQPPVNGENATCKNYETMATEYQDEHQPGSKETLRLEAKILICESPSLIYISLLHQQKTFNELFEDIQKFYAKRKTPRRGNWKVNDRCCAFCIQSQTWRRATILDRGKELVTVFFTDFAQTEAVPISNLKKLHSDFEMIGDAAIKCHLAGVLPADGEWPSLTKEFLKDKLEEYKRVFVTKVGEFEDKSMPIQLWVYHTELGSALEPNESEWRCLNAELVQRGLALPDTRQTEPSTQAQEDELRFLNVRGSVQTWLLPPLPGSVSSDEAAAEWLPAEPLRGAEFTAVPTYIDNEGVIYLHDVSQEDDLEFIRDTLLMAFKADDPKAAYCSWRVGEPCVARYYLDSQFYRGIVLEVRPEQANCLVQYVDYGNSETCAFVDLRKRIALHQIPIQSHKVSLARIKPVGEQWDLTVLDYIHKAIVEKKCFVKVVAPPLDDVTPVDLKYDKLWINDHLVEFDLAEYIDGSKPIDRKFKKKSKPTFSTLENKKTVVTEAENKTIEINSSSEPDYIVEEESSEASGSPDSFKMSTLVDRGSSPSEKDNTGLVSYLRHEDREFSCNIPVINDTNSLELLIVRDAETHATYEALLDIVKEQGKNMPPLDGTFEYKPCIALFEDHWYRASILKYSEAKNLVKVHYVDYGNIGIVPLCDVREISKDWACLPPACVTARLHGVRVNPDLDPDDVTKSYIDTFLDKGPFRATIVDYVDYDNSVPLVELRNTDGELVYKKLIDENVFLYDTRDCASSGVNEIVS